MAAEAALAPVRGSRLLRIAVADVIAGCRSAPECELRALVLRSRVLPEPQWNRPLPDLPDISPDGWWEEARLVLEVDSVEHHSLGPDAEHTQRRQARLAAAGWTVLPIGPRRIRREPVPLLLEIEAAYRAGLAPRRPW
jgi:very-short-patch-repair endonuclease